MKYNRLGRSGLKVSALSFGSWLTFGSTVDVSAARTLMKAAFDRGVNFFDNAEVYGNGKSEEIMGEVLKGFRREDVVISTKIFWGGEGPNDTGCSWKHLVEGTRRSLRRLNLQYVDLLYCHRPDPTTPIEETVRAMDYLIKSGSAFYWGTSEWSAEQIRTAYELAYRYNCVPPTMEQPQYNMFARARVEQEYTNLFTDYGMGTTIWSPLASGVLTEKYLNGIPPGSRLATVEWLRERMTEEKLATVRRLVKVAAAMDCTMAQLAIAWCLKNPNVSTVILGATSVPQLEENLRALEVVERIDAAGMAAIEKELTGAGKE